MATTITDPAPDAPASPPGSVAEVVHYFLRLGFVAFGGPAAHTAMMREELVKRRHWVDDAAFMDLVGACNLIPGPNSTELAIHLGYHRAGWRGLFAAGACFISPAVAIVLACAWAYQRYGQTPQAAWLLYGVKPVIVAIVLWALWGLSRTAIKGPLTGLLGLATIAFAFLGVNELLLLLFAAFVAVGIRELQRLYPLLSVTPSLWLPTPFWPLVALPEGAAAYSLTALFLTFLKIGSVLYGSGYVLLAFLRADFVERLHWLTDQQLLDAVAVGQFTPGPVFTTATFIGYVIGGWPGAAAATVGIFLPAFLFVAISIPLLARLRRSTLFRAALDGINAASLGLMAVVCWQLGRAALIDPLTIALALIALALIARLPRLNSAWLVLAGALIGAGRGLF